MISVVLVVFFISSQLTNGSEVCRSEYVPYTIYYNEYIHANLYACPVPKKRCEEYGFSIMTPSRANDSRFCVTRTQGRDTFIEPNKYRDKYTGKTYKIELCTRQVQADTVNDVIHLPWDGDFTEKYSSGKYVYPNFGTVVWETVDHCNLMTIYKGSVNVISFGENATEKYVFGESSNGKFSLKLVKKKKLCNREMWETNQPGVLTVSSEQNRPVEVSSAYSHLLKFEGDEMKRICDLTTTVLSVHIDIISDLQDTVSKMVIIGVVVLLCLGCVLTNFIVQCIVNCVALKRKRKFGVHLLRSCSTHLTYNYLYANSDDPVEVHHYDTLSYGRMNSR